MKKATIIIPLTLLVGILLFSLISIFNKKNEIEIEEKNLKYEKENTPPLILLIEEVKNKYPNRQNNIITKEEFISELQNKYDSLLESETLLQNSMFRLSSMDKLNNNYYLVSFTYDKSDYYFIKYFPDFSLYIRGIIPREKAKELSVGKRYILSGKNIPSKKDNKISDKSSDKYDFGIIILDSLNIQPY